MGIGVGRPEASASAFMRRCDLLFLPLCPAEWPQRFNRWSGVIQWCHHGIFACYIKDDLMMLPGSTWLVFAVCVYASYYIFFQTAFLRRDRAERVFMTAKVLFPKRVCPASCYVLRLCGNTAHVFGLRRSHGNCKQLVTSQWWIILWVKRKLPLGRGSLWYPEKSYSGHLNIKSNQFLLRRLPLRKKDGVKLRSCSFFKIMFGLDRRANLELKLGLSGSPMALVKMGVSPPPLGWAERVLSNLDNPGPL